MYTSGPDDDVTIRKYGVDIMGFEKTPPVTTFELPHFLPRKTTDLLYEISSQRTDLFYSGSTF
jgi:hypothetical protein